MYKSFESRNIDTSKNLKNCRDGNEHSNIFFQSLFRSSGPIFMYKYMYSLQLNLVNIDMSQDMRTKI